MACHGGLDLPTEILDLGYGFCWTMHVKRRTVLNKMAFSLLTKMQNLEMERAGKQAPSKPMLKARFFNPEALITAMAQLFSAEK